MTKVFGGSIFLEHDTGPTHPESKARLAAVLEAIPCTETVSANISPERAAIIDRAIAAVHDPDVAHLIHQASRGGLQHLDADTVVGPKSDLVSRLAVHTALSALQGLFSDETSSALCLTRPPGHHATREKSMGFCLMNAAAIAAQYAIDKLGIERVLIVDWDVHHGNGTQDIFYEREDVSFFSIHRWPFYPGSGTSEETGSGRGLGTTINVPISFGTSRKDYLDRFSDGLDKAWSVSRPELVIISAGFDAHELDPIGNLGLKTEDFHVMTKILKNRASNTTRPKILSLLEGGYHPKALAACVFAHLEALGS